MAFQQGKVRYQYKYWLGYRKGEDGQPEIIPEDAETVREIFRLFLDGYSIGDVHGKKRIVWRCLNRLEHGSKYCHSSPTIHEEPLHRTIIREINAFYACGEDVAELLKENAEAVLAGLGQAEITSVESRLAQIDKARKNMIDSIVSGVCEEEALYAEFEKLHAEEEELTAKLQALKVQCQISAEEQRQLETTLEDVENAWFELDCFDNVLVRKLIECVRVLNKEKIQMIFKGGYEVTAEMEK